MVFCKWLSKYEKPHAEKFRVIRKPEDFLSEEARRLIKINNLTLLEVIESYDIFKKELDRTGGKFRTTNPDEAREQLRGILSYLIILYEFLESEGFTIEIEDLKRVVHNKEMGREEKQIGTVTSEYWRAESAKYYRTFIQDYLEKIKMLKSVYGLDEFKI